MVERWPGGPTPVRREWLRALISEAAGDARGAHEHYADDVVDPITQAVPLAHAELLYSLAIGHLGQARDIFARLRAAPYLERCTAELEACGLRSRVEDPLVLTEGEEDVAALARWR